jgi:hypothetical protein
MTYLLNSGWQQTATTWPKPIPRNARPVCCKVLSGQLWTGKDEADLQAILRFKDVWDSAK